MWPLGKGRLLYRVSLEKKAPLLKHEFESHCVLSVNVYSASSPFQALERFDYTLRQTVQATGDREVGGQDVGLVKTQLLLATGGPRVREVTRVGQGCPTCCFTDLAYLKANTSQP